MATDLRPLYRQMAEAGGNFQGLSILQHKAEIGVLIQKYKATSLLDFGCGRGDPYFTPYQIHREWGVSRPTLYDPAFNSHDVPPFKGHYFDGVLCSDVLEHVPEDVVEDFIAELFSYSRQFVWASVCCRLAKKAFPDGTNLHVTVQPLGWWKRRFKEKAGKLDWYLTETP